MHREWIWLVLVLAVVALGVALAGRSTSVEPALGVAATASASSGPRVASPEFVKIVAHYGPGDWPSYRDWRSWTISMEASGRVLVQLGGRTEEARVAPGRASALFKTVADERFFDLKPEYDANFFDQRPPELRLTAVTAGGQEHTVRVYGPAVSPDDPEMFRFLHIWAALLRAVPSPNKLHGDGPELYR